MVSNCYRPQHHTIGEFCDSIETIIEAASNIYDSMIFIGDMNARNSAFWESDQTNHEGRSLYNFFRAHNYYQIINEPTRIVNDTKTCIDLIFTNNKLLFTECGVRSKLHDLCDHLPIYGNVHCNTNKKPCFKRFVWNYKRGDYDRFRQMLLNANWNQCYRHTDIDKITSEWTKLFLSIAESCIPHYEVTIRPRDKTFMNSTIRRLMRERDRFHRLAKVNPDPQIIRQ